MVLKELILTLSIFWECVSFLKELNSTVSTLQGCGGLESPVFKSFYFGMV